MITKGFSYALGGVILPFIILKVGRVTLLTNGLLFQCLSYILMMIGSNLNLIYLIPIGIYLFEMTFTLSVGGVLYVYLVEILPDELIPLSSIICWFCKIVIGSGTLIFIDDYGIYALFMLFFGLSLIGYVLVKGFGVETMGKSKSKIYAEFQKKSFSLSN